MQKPRDWREGMKHSSTAQTMRHLRVEVMDLCEGAGLYQIDLLNGSKERVSEAEYWARRRGQLKLDRENAGLAATGQQPKQKKFETVKVACRGKATPFAAQTARSLKSPTGAFVALQTRTLRKQISSVLYRATSFEDFSDKLMQQYGITVKESRGCLSCVDFSGCVRQGAPCFFVFRPLVRDFQTCYSYILSSHDGSLRRLSPHMPENQIQFARRTIH